MKQLQVVVKAPMVLELSVDETLERRAAFLCTQLGLSEGELGQLLVRHPQLLTCTEDMLAQRVAFLKDHGLNQYQICRAVMAHPQVRAALAAGRRVCVFGCLCLLGGCGRVVLGVLCWQLCRRGKGGVGRMAAA
jgi:hypothetical protein